MEECPIPEEIVVEILCRLPRKSLFRFKCVSKRWWKLISDRSLVTPKTTKSGLVFHCVKLVGLSREESFLHCSGTYLRLDSKGGASVDDSIGYNLMCNCTILDSCDGFLLLFQTFKESIGIGLKYYVHNPTTKWTEPVVPPNHLNSYRAGLFFDGNHFRVVFFCMSSDPLCLLFHVYSSKDKKWRTKALDSPLGHPLHIPILSFVKSLFFKGALHWYLQDHILIYHLQDEFCKLIKLPSVENTMHFWGSYIWQFEGRLHYCRVCGDEINIWVLHMEEQNYITGLQCFVWQQKHSGVLVLPNSVTLPPYYLCPFAFNEDFEILYIRFEESVISYNVATRKQKVAYRCLQKTEDSCSIQHVGYPYSVTGRG